MAAKIVLINGSYRREGAVSQALALAAEAAREAGAGVTEYFLPDLNVEFCRNCRACTQEPGEKRGACVIKDAMPAILDAMDGADGLMLGAPVNFYNVTAVTRRFMERLIPYAYWPWGQGAPKMRVKVKSKRAVLITASGAPSMLARVAFPGALNALGALAETVGAKPEGSMFIGMAAMSERYLLTPSEKAKARRLGGKLAGWRSGPGQ